MKRLVSLHGFLLLLPALIYAGCMRSLPQAAAPLAFLTRSVAGQPPSNLQGPAVRRIRAVDLNMEVLKQTRLDSVQSTEMDFFPDVAITVNWTRIVPVENPAGYLWTGKIAGAPAGEAVMTVSGNNVSASVQRGDGLIYEIRTAPGAGWWVREMDQKKFPQESQPVTPNLK